MWYEILPCFSVIVAGLGLPGWTMYQIHNLVLGNHYRRAMNDRWQRNLYQRDVRLTNSAYTVVGLEAIPDK